MVDASGRDFAGLASVAIAVSITSTFAASVSGIFGGLTGWLTGEGFAKGFGQGFVSGFIGTAIPLLLETATGGKVPPYLAFGFGGAVGELVSQSIFNDLSSPKAITSIILTGLTGGILGKFAGPGAVESFGVLVQKIEPAIKNILKAYSTEIALNGLGGSLKNSAKDLINDLLLNGGKKTGQWIKDATSSLLSTGAGIAGSSIGPSATIATVTVSGNILIDLIVAANVLIKKVAATGDVQ